MISAELYWKTAGSALTCCFLVVPLIWARNRGQSLRSMGETVRAR